MEAIYDSELHILVDRDLQGLVIVAQEFGIDIVYDLDTMVKEITNFVKRMNQEEKMYDRKLNRPRNNYQMSLCLKCKKGHVSVVLRGCGHYLCFGCVVTGQLKCPICSTIKEITIYLAEHELKLSIPEDMCLSPTPGAAPSDTNPEGTDELLSVNPAALPPGSPRRFWSDHEIQDALQIFQKMSLREMQLFLASVNVVAGASKQECYKALVKKYKSLLSKKTSLLRLLGPGMHCRRCLRSGAIELLLPCRHTCCGPCLSLVDKKCPKCLGDVKYEVTLAQA